MQIDETAICNGRIITDPANTMDDTPNIQWIIGGVEKNNVRKLFLFIAPNRKKETILYMLNKFVKPGSIIVTDGYPSYPYSVQKFNSVHKVVNHTTGFKNEEGYTTNKIENILSHFKTVYRSRHGLNHCRIPSFINEFVSRKSFAFKRSSAGNRRVFMLLLTMLSRT